jgi:hypothetical protein
MPKDSPLLCEQCGKNPRRRAHDDVYFKLCFQCMLPHWKDGIARGLRTKAKNKRRHKRAA